MSRKKVVLRRRKKTDSPPAPKKHSDGWTNALTQVGTAFDKRRYTGMQVDESLHNREIQEEVWEGDPMFARIIEKPANEMMRAGFEFTISDSKAAPSQDVAGGEGADAGLADEGKTGSKPRTDAPPPPSAVGTALAGPPPKPPAPVDIESTTKPDEDAVMVRWLELHGPELYLEALLYEAAYGGSAIFPGANDGATDLTKPLDLEKIKTFQWANVFTPRELQAVRWYDNPGEPNYGKPMIYRAMPDLTAVSDLSSSGGKPDVRARDWLTREIHESRLIIFPGESVSRRARFRRNGWGNSALVRVWQALQDFHNAYGSAAHLLTDFAQAVIKIKGLADLIFQNDDDAVGKRAQLIDLSRSVARAVILDSEEDFERKSTPVMGLPELMQRFEQFLSAVADMPVALLMGREPSGLNATGDMEMEQWHATLGGRQNNKLKPRVERFLRLIMLSKDGPTGGVEPPQWSIKFNPLGKPDDMKQADIRLKQSQADVAYINASVLLPEEVAKSRFGGPDWSAKTTLDIEARKKAAVEHEQQVADQQAKAADQADMQVKTTEHSMKQEAIASKAKMVAAFKKPAPKK